MEVGREKTILGLSFCLWRDLGHSLSFLLFILHASWARDFAGSLAVTESVLHEATRVHVQAVVDGRRVVIGIHGLGLLRGVDDGAGTATDGHAGSEGQGIAPTDQGSSIHQLGGTGHGLDSRGGLDYGDNSGDGKENGGETHLDIDFFEGLDGTRRKKSER